MGGLSLGLLDNWDARTWELDSVLGSYLPPAFLGKVAARKSFFLLSLDTYQRQVNPFSPSSQPLPQSRLSGGGRLPRLP